MAVPKKRTSKAKSRSRKSTWQKKAYYAQQKAISAAKSMLTKKSSSFVYLNDEWSQEI